MTQPSAKQPLLPLAIKPKLYPRESLYSWLIRAASYNGLPAPVFTNLYWTYKNRLLHIQLNKKYPNKTFKDEILQLCGKQPIVFADFLNVDDCNHTYFLLSHLYKRSGSAHGYQYCPKCIAEQQENAYLPIEWDMASHTVCTKHHILMQNSCTNCGKFYTPHKASLRPIEQCAYCGCSMAIINKDISTHPLYDKINIPRLLKLQQQINNYIDSSIHPQICADSHPNHTHSFYYLGMQLEFRDFLSLLVYFIKLARHHAGIPTHKENSIYNQFIKAMKWERYASGYKFVGVFNTLSAVERALLLSCACDFLDLSADNWVQITHELNIKQGYFSAVPDKDNLPEPLLRIIGNLPVTESKKRAKSHRPTEAGRSLKQVKTRWSQLLKKMDREFYV
ncbi:TniQ family protein [Moraxella pluranimalium]|nr:TniQ family protein [Moraxella pluranimalium]